MRIRIDRTNEILEQEFKESMYEWYCRYSEIVPQGFINNSLQEIYKHFKFHFEKEHPAAIPPSKRQSGFVYWKNSIYPGIVLRYEWYMDKGDYVVQPKYYGTGTNEERGT